METDSATTDIKGLLAKQRDFFDSGQTKDIAFRKEALEALYDILRESEGKVLDALGHDLSKSDYEGYMTEFGIILEEIRFVKKQLSKWARPRRVRTHLFQFPASSYIYPEPYGISLIISPRIVSGKFINAGQTCIAPDYLLVHCSVKTGLTNRIQSHLHQFYGEDPQRSPDYPRIINDKHFKRLAEFLTTGNIISGGQTDRQELYIAPTLLDDIGWDDPIMQNEIFGPLLPVIGYDDLSEAISQVRTLPRPLALYFFSNNRHGLTSRCDTRPSKTNLSC